MLDMPVKQMQILPKAHTSLNIPNLKSYTIPEDVIAKVPAALAYRYKVVPMAFCSNVLTVAHAHPQDIYLLDALNTQLPYLLKPVLADEAHIAEALRRYYGVGAETIAGMMSDKTEIPAPAAALLEESAIGSEASVAKFVQQIFAAAHKDRATDIHIEPQEKILTIRYRVDGVLYDAQVPSNAFHFRDAISSRIKILARLNIAEKRLPQDGRLKVRLDDVELDMRVSFLPTPWGESVVLRLLNSTRPYELSDLGLAGRDLKILDAAIQNPNGIIFVTGPTGSGKTTTLYACLSRLNTTAHKIITIEDPIEYQLRGVTQIQVHPKIGLSFAQGLRSMLRHDPDIMMVGEVRDYETAEIAIQTALTGHLVFSTLHTNDAAGGITRLLDMGVEPFLIASSVQCFIAQRLVRMICPLCKETKSIDPQAVRRSSVLPSGFEQLTVYHGKGCDLCKHTGYYGRQAIYEFLPVTPEIRTLIMDRADAVVIKKKAVEQGMHTLRQDGWMKIRQGITTIQEVLRVTSE